MYLNIAELIPFVKSSLPSGAARIPENDHQIRNHITEGTYSNFRSFD